MKTAILILSLFFVQSGIAINAGATMIKIISPAPGATIIGFNVLVVGSVTPALSDEREVNINGSTVAIDATGGFAAAVPVSLQTTNITVTAPDGASAMIPITVQGSEPTLTLKPLPTEGGVAPLTVKFDLSSLVSITQISLDSHGSGTVDFQGSALEGQSFVFQQPGVYYPAITVTSNGVMYSTVALIQVYDATAFDALLQGKWQAFKNALRAEDTVSALRFIAEDERSQFQGVFSNLAVPLSYIDQILGNIVFVRISGNTVEYEMLDANRRQPSSLVRFVLDHDGIWRIQDL